MQDNPVSTLIHDLLSNYDLSELTMKGWYQDHLHYTDQVEKVWRGKQLIDLLKWAAGVFQASLISQRHTLTIDSKKLYFFDGASTYQLELDTIAA